MNAGSGNNICFHWDPDETDIQGRWGIILDMLVAGARENKVPKGGVIRLDIDWHGPQGKR